MNPISVVGRREGGAMGSLKRSAVCAVAALTPRWQKQTL